MKKKIHNNVTILTNCKPSITRDIWFIHGLGENSSYFSEFFNHPLSKIFNVYIVDLPGYGDSPYQSDKPGILGAKDILIDLIKDFSLDHELFLVAHSSGTLIGTLACLEIRDQVKLYINIEGLFIPDDSRSSSKANYYKVPDDFKDFFVKTMKSAIKSKEDIFSFYHQTVLSSDPRALYSWSKDIISLVSDRKLSKSYKELPCNKLYITGENTFLKMDREIAKTLSTVVSIKNSTHWPMLENKADFYKIIANCISLAN